MATWESERKKNESCMKLPTAILTEHPSQLTPHPADFTPRQVIALSFRTTGSRGWRSGWKKALTDNTDTQLLKQFIKVGHIRRRAGRGQDHHEGVAAAELLTHG